MKCPEIIEQQPRSRIMHDCETKYESICSADYDWIDTGTVLGYP